MSFIVPEEIERYASSRSEPLHPLLEELSLAPGARGSLRWLLEGARG